MLMLIAVGLWLGVIVFEITRAIEGMGRPRILRKRRPLSHYVRLYRYEVWDDIGVPQVVDPTLLIPSGSITAAKIQAETITFRS